MQKTYRKIVFKIGSSTLTYPSGRLNLRRIEKLVMVLSDLKNGGREIALVSSGAVAAGHARAGTKVHPASVAEKQAYAAIGQSELMKIYDRFFSLYGHTVGQILMTRDAFDNNERREAVKSTFGCLFDMGIVPVINENDSVSTTELQFGGNDTLSAYVAAVCEADLLVNLSDVDGFFDGDPRIKKDAKLIKTVDKITKETYKMAGGAGSARGTGGMERKLFAAEISVGAGIPMIIMNGTNPELIYEIFSDNPAGTYFKA
jgi:glutamate 5-kinase